MKKLLLIAMCLTLTLIGGAAATMAHSFSSDPCDGYGNCVSSSISYTRANPDNSLYLGDQFSIQLSILPSSGGAQGVSWSGQWTNTMWAFDTSAFGASATGTSADFTVTTNQTASYTITATASFFVTITTCTTDSSGKTTCTTSYVTTSVPVSVQVSLRAFVLSFQTKLVNATTPLHQTRRNPDGSFYPFDAFYLNYSYSFQFIQQRSDIKTYVIPTFDHVILNLTKYSNSTSTGYFFFQMDNRTGSFQVTTKATAYNWLKQVLGTRQTTTPFGIIPLVIDFPTKMLNVTASNPLVTGGKMLLRNPDGSFYRNDSFAASWNATFKFSDVRKDIRVNVTSANPPYLKTTGLVSDKLGRNGTFTYRIGVSAAYQPYSLVLKAEAFNYYNNSLALTTSKQPYAVVQYHPFFTYFTYMLYNSRNSSTYAKPFVTLVRYGGNDPGYSYTGDINTSPITTPNDTAERAWINNFTFSTTGWNESVFLRNVDVGQDVIFNRVNVTVAYRSLNSTYPVVMWADRVQKYYFSGNLAAFESYEPNGVNYYNLTAHAYSKDFAGSARTPLFNTTYLYEPVQYSGFLNFRFYDSYGNPDTSANVTIISHNPSPLNVYLIGRVRTVFGNDSQVLKAFQRDLYSSNYTMTLRQLQPNTHGMVVYLINQTNLAMPEADLFPWFNITIYSGQSTTSFRYFPQSPYLADQVETNCFGAPPHIFWEYLSGLTCREFSYAPLDGFGLFMINSTVLRSLPFAKAMAYYAAPYFDNLILPVNSTLSGSPAYYINWYAGLNSTINVNVPLSKEPGTLTNLYQLVYGQNSTVFVNTAGGGIGFLWKPKPLQNGTYYQFSFLINPQSGGVTRLTITSDQGETLANESLYPTTATNGFSPPGYYGPYSIVTSLGNTNSSVTATFINAWGAKTAITGIQVTPPKPSPTAFPWGLLTLVVLILLGLDLLQHTIKRRRAGEPRPEESEEQE